MYLFAKIGFDTAEKDVKPKRWLERGGAATSTGTVKKKLLWYLPQNLF